jgi:hypothetical protein
MLVFVIRPRRQSCRSSLPSLINGSDHHCVTRPLLLGRLALTETRVFDVARRMLTGNAPP